MPAGVMRPRAPASTMRSAVTSSANSSNEPAKKLDQVDAGGQCGDEPVDGAHVELLSCELDDVGHQQSCGPAWSADLVAVGERGLEAVVAVGDHDRVRARRQSRWPRRCRAG